jgi:hypothetical protein
MTPGGHLGGHHGGNPGGNLGEHPERNPRRTPWSFYVHYCILYELNTTMGVTLASTSPPLSYYGDSISQTRISATFPFSG